MITVENALDLINENVKTGDVTHLNATESLGYTLAAAVFSPINMPPFSQSAMDGYAVNYQDNIVVYEMIGEIAAGGKYKHFDLQKGQAVRIYTGAPVPKGATIVVKQEIAITTCDTVSFTEDIKIGENIRPVGEQIKAGELALAANTKITPGGVGFLTSLGVAKVTVFKKPTIIVIVTGDELIKPNEILSEGKIYESNSFMLSGGLTQIGYPNHKVIAIKDTYEETEKAISNALSDFDVVILSGGISVGDYDFVGKALNKIGVTEVFYKVKQKPGKPLYFGKKENKYVFALPGNPAASLTSFYIYVVDALAKITGQKEGGIKKSKGFLSKGYIKKGNRAQFLKAFIDSENKVAILEGQSSAMLHTFAISNAIVYIPIDKSEVKEGEEVVVYLLP